MTHLYLLYSPKLSAALHLHVLHTQIKVARIPPHVSGMYDYEHNLGGFICSSVLHTGGRVTRCGPDNPK